MLKHVFCFKVLHFLAADRRTVKMVSWLFGDALMNGKHSICDLLKGLPSVASSMKPFQPSNGIDGVLGLLPYSHSKSQFKGNTSLLLGCTAFRY